MHLKTQKIIKYVTSQYVRKTGLRVTISRSSFAVKMTTTNFLELNIAIAVFSFEFHFVGLKSICGLDS